MEKRSLVQPAHVPGPHINSYGGCFARVGHKGMCPGVDLANWLNGLGPDDGTYITVRGRRITNLEVRTNWVRGSVHVKWFNEKQDPPVCPTCNGRGRLDDGRYDRKW